MKIKKIIAAAAAAVVAVSTMAISAFADDTYHAYLNVQTNPGWIYRDAWDSDQYGRDVAGWDYSKLAANGEAADIAGTFTDVEITADGTYKVSLTGADLSGEEKFSQLYVSTDIPMGNATVTNVKVTIDGQEKYTFDEAYQADADKKSYVDFHVINIWNDDLGGDEGLFGYMMPNDSVEIEFTISGLGSGEAASNEADTAEAPAETPAETTTTTSPTTGNVPAAVMVSVMAVAGAAAVVSKKRK